MWLHVAELFPWNDFKKEMSCDFAAVENKRCERLHSHVPQLFIAARAKFAQGTPKTDFRPTF